MDLHLVARAVEAAQQAVLLVVVDRRLRGLVVDGQTRPDGVLAVVVALDTMKQLEAQLMMRNYEGFLK